MALADLAQQILHRHLAVVEDDLSSGGNLDSKLLLFRADNQTLKALLHQEGGEVLLVDLGENGIQLGETTVGDELLGAVQDVVLAVFGEHRGGLGSKGVAAGARFGEAVGRRPLTGDQFLQIFLFLLLGSVVDERQGADTGVAGIGHREGACLGHSLRHQHGGRLVQLETAELFGCIHHQQAKLAAFFQSIHHDVEVLLVDLLHMGPDLVLYELLGGLRHLAVLIGEIFGSEHCFARCFRNQVFPAFQYLSHFRPLRVYIFCHDQFSYQSFSKRPAAPMPPPMHMDTMPYLAFLRPIS